MLTQAAIPPGGEGEIEVTFNSAHKRGLQRKTVTVFSNDPRRSTAMLHITAKVEVEFGFERPSLNVGRLSRGDTKRDTVVLLLKDASKRTTLTFEASAPYVRARPLSASGDSAGRIPVEVVFGPGARVGRIRESVTARVADRAHPTAVLRIFGTLLGNVQLLPEFIRFEIDSTHDTPERARQQARVEIQPGSGVHILRVWDPAKLVEVDLDTVVADTRYVIRAQPTKEALEQASARAGSITVKTDDAEQPELSLRYSLLFKKP